MVSLTNSVEETPQRNGGRPYPANLHQWVLNPIPPVVVVICRLFWRTSWRNVANIPNHGGLIIAANHQTYIDPFWICAAVKRPVRFLAWDAAFSWPIVGFCLRLLGAWPLQLEGSDP